MKYAWIVVVGSCVASCLGSTARAQYATGFEAPDYSGSTTGTLLTMGLGGGGQAGWYLPDIAGSVDTNVFAYAGNALNIAANPGGSGQFLACQSAGGTSLARAQHPATFAADGTYTASWDVLGIYVGAPPSVDNLGSFSLQPSPTANYFQQLMQWGTNTPTADRYNFVYGVFGASGTTGGGAGIAFLSPGTDWQNIPVNHWIRQTTTWSFSSNRLLSISIRDITAGTPEITMDVSGMEWYLSGGANNAQGLPAPTDVRCFGGGGAGNVSAWDNIDIAQVFSCHGRCIADFDDGSGTGTPDGGITIDDLLYYLTLYGDGAVCADVDNGTFTGTTDGGVTIDDLLYFLFRYGEGC